MNITLKKLKEHEACKEGIKAFKSLKRDTINIYELVKMLDDNKDSNGYIYWLFNQFKLTGVCRGWYSNGKLRYEGYYLNGQYHNTEGPAINWYENGKLSYEEYYLNGEKLTKEQWEKKKNTRHWQAIVKVRLLKLKV